MLITWPQINSGYFVSPPIIETLAVFYEFNGIRVDRILSDPENEVDRPIGVLALAAAAVTPRSIYYCLHGLTLLLSG